LTLSPATRAVLHAVAATLVVDGPPDLGERVAEKIASLPRPADRRELDLLLRLLDSSMVNLLISGIPRAFTRMSPAQRERCLRGWATSRLPQRRKAFQALKRLTTVTHYTTPGVARAIGYPGPLGPPPATPKPIRPVAIERDTTLTCDVVIVGSGAGGGVVAAELAAAGKDVVVLEKGGYRNEADFTHLEGDALETLYDAGGLLATSDLGLVVLQGATLGGGTVINYTTSFPTPEPVRRQWAKEHNLPHFESAEFTRSLDAVARRIGVNTDHAKPSARDQVLIRGLEQLGWHHGLLPRDVRNCPQDDACGYCGMGCRRGAKQSTLITYLEDAAQRGARMVVNCDVRRVLIERSAATSRRRSASLRSPSRSNATDTSPRGAASNHRESPITEIASALGVRALGPRALIGHECSQARDGSEDLLVAVRIVLDRDAVALLERHRELERVDRIEAQALDEQRRLALDLLGRDVLEHQRLHDEPLQLRLEPTDRVHSCPFSHGHGVAAPAKRERNARVSLRAAITVDSLPSRWSFAITGSPTRRVYRPARTGT